MAAVANDQLPLDRDRLARILAPWSEGAGLTITIEDTLGATVAGPAAIDGPPNQGDRVTADVTVAGAVIARVVATGPRAAESMVGGVVRSLAIAIAELLTETHARLVAERTLQDHRSADTASSLGIDAVELAKGRRQQRSILSLVAPDVPGYELASHYAAAREIGGDFFELFRLPRRGHPLGIVIADVSGKGLDAALLMAFARPVMHAALNAAHEPAGALMRTNRVLVDERRGTLFITALCGLLHPRTGLIRIANAGHEPPLLVPADGGAIRPVGDAGVLLGLFASITPPAIETNLEPGDVLVFYTDGVTDAVDPTGRRFGDDRLLATLEAARGGSAQELIDALRTAVEAFQAGADPADDVTIVALGRVRPRRRTTRA